MIILVLEVLADVVGAFQPSPLGAVDEAHVVRQIQRMGRRILLDLLGLLGLRQSIQTCGLLRHIESCDDDLCAKVVDRSVEKTLTRATGIDGKQDLDALD
jgi:hypothetical protein